MQAISIYLVVTAVTGFRLYDEAALAVSDTYRKGTTMYYLAATVLLLAQWSQSCILESCLVWCKTGPLPTCIPEPVLQVRVSTHF